MVHKKEKIIILSLILILIIAVIGVSYAAFSYTGTGKTVNSITTGAITMTYTESDNVIMMDEALPTTDKTGTVRLKEGEYFDFTISSNIIGNVNINYEISAKEVGNGTIDGENIKLYLTRLKSDGSEEALMVPETYSEEASANSYTGRPSGEMSLYTNSMNSSESNNYRLRMYVTEEYNPQGDGGGLTFSVQINVYGKDGDKYVPETTETILANNPLQEDKTNMFNYASNGDILTDPLRMEIENDPEYVTNGLYQLADEDGVSYYFRGDVTNNNVRFGKYTDDYYVYTDGGLRHFQSLESCVDALGSSEHCTPLKLASQGDDMYWKIVRVNGDGSLRLIYNGTSAEPTNTDIVDSYVIGYTSYNSYMDDAKYTGYTYDNGTDSFIKKEIDTWYKNTLGNSSYDDMVIGGRFCSDSSGYKLGTDYGLSIINYNVFASYDRLGQAISNFSKANAPTLKCPVTNESYGGDYRLKAGLITADEMVLAGENMYLSGNSYLNVKDSSAYYWTMTPSSFNNNGSGWYQSNSIYVSLISDIRAVRPVINVMANTDFVSGDGTIDNPYVLSV